MGRDCSLFDMSHSRKKVGSAPDAVAFAKPESLKYADVPGSMVMATAQPSMRPTGS